MTDKLCIQDPIFIVKGSKTCAVMYVADLFLFGSCLTDISWLCYEIYLYATIGFFFKCCYPWKMTGVMLHLYLPITASSLQQPLSSELNHSTNYEPLPWRTTTFSNLTFNETHGNHFFDNSLDWLIDGFGVFDGMVAYLQTKGQIIMKL